jgi:hypothetical protein
VNELEKKIGLQHCIKKKDNHVGIVTELLAKVPEILSVEANRYLGLQLRKKYMVAKSLGLTGYL